MHKHKLCALRLVKGTETEFQIEILPFITHDLYNCVVAT